MSAKIHLFPVSMHVGLVDRLVHGYVERFNDPGEGIRFLEAAFEEIAELLQHNGAADENIRDQLIELLSVIASGVQLQFRLDVAGLDIEVPCLSTSFVYEQEMRGVETT